MPSFNLIVYSFYVQNHIEYHTVLWYYVQTLRFYYRFMRFIVIKLLHGVFASRDGSVTILNCYADFHNWCLSSPLFHTGPRLAVLVYEEVIQSPFTTS